MSTITKVAKLKTLKARAGESAIPKIVGVAFGDGGTDLNGNLLVPNEYQTELRHEIYRKEIDSYVLNPDTNECRYYCVLSNDELAGQSISEIALYDEEGDFVAIENFMAKSKNSDVELTITIKDTF